MDRSGFVHNCNDWAANGMPFLFVIDYELAHFHILPLEKAAGQEIFYKVGEQSNLDRALLHHHPGTVNEPSGLQQDQAQQDQAQQDQAQQDRAQQDRAQQDQAQQDQAQQERAQQDQAQQDQYTYFSGSGAVLAKGQQQTSRENGRSDAQKFPGRPPQDFRFDLTPVPFSRYEKAFKLVQKNILHGNSFLLNLTFPTAIDTDLSLDEIFLQSLAPYKLYFKDQFVLFSPETFIRIRDGKIFSYPMKGTIDASVPQAEQTLMENEKELREHNTIVDLIRNDLSMVARDVEVTKYRYIDRVRTHKNELLQVSSEISGQLGGKWKERLGEILLQLLPAGSISGAPKKKTREIIAAAEGEKRGYFTGIFGIFDGDTVDSAVMIRFIERTGSGLQFRSGGGITGHSDVQQEYNEMIDKVYVPFI